MNRETLPSKPYEILFEDYRTRMSGVVEGSEIPLPNAVKIDGDIYIFCFENNEYTCYRVGTIPDDLELTPPHVSVEYSSDNHFKNIFRPKKGESRYISSFFQNEKLIIENTREINCEKIDSKPVND